MRYQTEPVYIVRHRGGESGSHAKYDRMTPLIAVDFGSKAMI